MSNTPPPNPPVDERFLIHASVEIRYLLKELQKHATLISISYSKTAPAILSSVLDITEQHLILEACQDNHKNKQIVQSRDIHFATRQNNVKISFSSTAINLIVFQQKPALQIDIPKHLTRVQRRDSYRLPTASQRSEQEAPLAPTCHIQLKNHTNNQLLKATIVNISTKGVALTFPEGCADMPIGELFNHCRLDLHAFGYVHVSLQIRNIFNIPLRNGKTIKRYGCAFINFNTSTINIIQRYILDMERNTLSKATFQRNDSL